MICLGEAYKKELVSMDFQDYNLRSEYDDVKLMQFTGLLDKIGKEIYEGDLIKVGNFGDLHEVIWEERAYYRMRKLGSNTGIAFYVNDRSLEVIGNIYENPELLTQ